MAVAQSGHSLANTIQPYFPTKVFEQTIFG